MKKDLRVSRSLFTVLLLMVSMRLVFTNYGGAVMAQGVTSSLGGSGVIFSERDTELAARDNPMSSLQGPYWTPTGAQVMEAESALTAYLKSHHSDEPAMLVKQRFHQYRFQYLGYSDHGKRFILINGFCDSFWKEDDSWKTRFVFVLDGGACFFHARFRVADSKIVEFETNGES